MNKRLFKICSFIEDLIATLLCTFLIIYVVGEPVGEYTIKIFILKILALIGFSLILKFESE
jgi:hypothetical protein